jgi:hypothetical protein
MDSARLAVRSGPHAVIFDLRTDTFFDKFSGVKRELLGYLWLVKYSCSPNQNPRNYEIIIIRICLIYFITNIEYC